MTNGSRVRRVLTWAMSKWTKHVVTFNEEEDEDTLVEEVPQIERGAVLHKGTCHREIHRRNFRDKQFPRKVCSEQDDVKVDETNRDHQ